MLSREQAWLQLQPWQAQCNPQLGPTQPLVACEALERLRPPVLSLTALVVQLFTCGPAFHLRCS
jgi:hypothetical protein